MSGKSKDDQHIISIDQMLKDLSNTTTTRPFIHSVDNILRRENEKEYDPVIIAIGPLHHGRDHLKNMEQHKVRYLKLLLESRQESSVDTYVKAMSKLEERARKFYGESMRLENDDEFVKMLLLDGIFIIKFLRKYCKFHKPETDIRKRNEMSQDDPIFKFPHTLVSVVRDLLMFENQIPLFVLKELCRLLEINGDEKSDLIQYLTFKGEKANDTSWHKTEHLLGLVHHASCYSYAQKNHSGEDNNTTKEAAIYSAKELKEAGVVFKKHEGTDQIISQFVIKFNNNTISIPPLEISDETEAKFRNMLAYEHYLPRTEKKCITDYILLLCCLIHSKEDAELLRRRGIITNLLGGDEMVYDLISKLDNNVISSESFSYLGIYRDINSHCQKRRNKWMAILRRDYFETPWSFISLVAAIVLLSTAVAQMVYAILSYNNKN